MTLGGSPLAPGRDRAVDMFRGATVALMILVNNPGTWKHLYPALEHAKWHGCTLTDLVFPFFLFAVGHALALSVNSDEQKSAPVDFAHRWWQRTAWIFGIGLFLNASPFVRWDAQGELTWRSWDTLRLMGVLQRIALCWALAALIVRWGRWRAALGSSAALLLGYWAACESWARGPDPYSLEGFFGTHWDRAWLGASHLYRGEGVPFDPEGLASTAPAVAQVLLGYLAGQWWLRRRDDPRLPLQWGLAAVALCVLGGGWQFLMPLNKKIWTSSYVLWTTGWAVAAMTTMVMTQRWSAHSRSASWCQSAMRPWGHLWVAFGRNALAIFALSGLVPRLLTLWRIEDGLTAEGAPRWITPLPWIYRTVFEPMTADPRASSLLFAMVTVGVYGALALWLDRRGLYWRV